jgi:hypothetical protein
MWGLNIALVNSVWLTVGVKTTTGTSIGPGKKKYDQIDKKNPVFILMSKKKKCK